MESHHNNMAAAGAYVTVKCQTQLDLNTWINLVSAIGFLNGSKADHALWHDLVHMTNKRAQTGRYSFDPCLECGRAIRF